MYNEYNNKIHFKHFNENIKEKNFNNIETDQKTPNTNILYTIY